MSSEAASMFSEPGSARLFRRWKRSLAVVALVSFGATLAGYFFLQQERYNWNLTNDAKNYHQMALAMHAFHDVVGHFPAAAICNADGKPLLSWRVAILPYLEQQKLYDQFKLNEPWDSAHNQKLLDPMPAMFALPGVNAHGDTRTHYRVFVGPDAPFTYCSGRRIADIKDGTSSTWMIVESQEAVPWTKPDELIYDAKKPLPKLGDFYAGGFSAVCMDGSVRHFSGSLPEKTIRALITHAGGEPQPDLNPH
jgi:hypothetical protein